MGKMASTIQAKNLSMTKVRKMQIWQNFTQMQCRTYTNFREIFLSFSCLLGSSHQYLLMLPNQCTEGRPKSVGNELATGQAHLFKNFTGLGTDWACKTNNNICKPEMKWTCEMATCSQLAVAFEWRQSK